MGIPLGVGQEESVSATPSCQHNFLTTLNNANFYLYVLCSLFFKKRYSAVTQYHYADHFPAKQVNTGAFCYICIAMLNECTFPGSKPHLVQVILYGVF